MKILADRRCIMAVGLWVSRSADDQLLLAGSAIPRRQIDHGATVAHVQAIDDGDVPKRSAALDTLSPNHLALLPLTSSQAKSGAATIFVNELDAGSFKCPSNDL
jgi:hypothetical protein